MLTDRFNCFMPRMTARWCWYIFEWCCMYKSPIPNYRLVLWYQIVVWSRCVTGSLRPTGKVPRAPNMCDERKQQGVWPEQFLLRGRTKNPLTWLNCVRNSFFFFFFWFVCFLFRPHTAYLPTLDVSKETQNCWESFRVWRLSVPSGIVLLWTEQKDQWASREF